MAEDPENDTYSEEETEARREAALKRMLATKPESHAEQAARQRAGRRLPATDRNDEANGAVCCTTAPPVRPL